MSPSPPPPTLDAWLEFAVAAAREAGTVALRYFLEGTVAEKKADDSPVTRADREAEKLLRRQLEKQFPDHGILGEEFGGVRQGAEFRWLLDPIDGTQTFIRGVPFWGVMVGLEQASQPILGVVDFPALRETLYARRDGGAWWTREGRTKRAQVSTVSRLEQATLLVTDVRGFAPVGLDKSLEQLRPRTGFERTWGDCYGHALVATGRAEIMLDPTLNEWDACALVPIVEEAGGRFTDWRGERTTRGGNGVTTNGPLFERVLKLLRAGSPSKEKSF